MSIQDKAAIVLGRCILRPFNAIFIMLSLWTGLAASTDDWTILVYMAADNGLSNYAYQDINEMESVALPNRTNVVVQADFNEYSPQTGAFRYKIRQDNSSIISSPILSNLGEIDSGNPQTLRDFISWGFRQYPATHKALIIWSHGDSWYKGSDYKWICPDDDSESILSVSEGDLATALGGCPLLDILLFDACSMQSLEVMNSVVNNAAYIVGSEDLVPVYGFPYQDILPIWQGEPLALVQQIPEFYVNSYAPYGSQNPDGLTVRATCSVWKTENLRNFISGLGSYSRLSDASLISVMAAARQHCYNLNSYDAEIDVLQLITYLSTQTADHYIQQDAIYRLSRLSELLISKAQINYPVELGAAALWFPTDQNTFLAWWSHYMRLPWMHGWLERVYYSFPEGIIPLPAPQIISSHQMYDRLSLQIKLLPYPEAIHFKCRFVNDAGNQIYDYENHNYSYYVSQEYETTLDRMNQKQSGWFYLRAIDERGNESAEDSLRVEYVEQPSFLHVYPNPVRQNSGVTFEWLGTENDLKKWTDKDQLQIYDVKGRNLRREPFGYVYSPTGHYICTINTAGLPTGVYIAVAKKYDGSKFKTKFCIIK